MRGDKLNIKPEHRRAGRALADMVARRLEEGAPPYVVTIGGESGSGKSELAGVLCGELEDRCIRTLVLQQDDYFVYPPLTNDARRRRDIRQVGMTEVHLALLDEHLARAKAGSGVLRKPLVIYHEDRIDEEVLDLTGVRVLVVEGTYTTALAQGDLKVFIERGYCDTRDARRERAREVQDDYLERILALEHAIISEHRPRARVIVTRDYEVVEQRPTLHAEHEAD